MKKKVGFLFDKSNLWIYEELKKLDWVQHLSQEYEFLTTFAPADANHLEILFVLGYTKILDLTLLKTNELNLVVHESALPKGRGFSPVQWQILDGANEIPVCLIQMAEEVDAGDIFATAVMKLNGDELLAEIRAAQACATKTLIVDFLSRYPFVERRVQLGTPSYYRRRTREDDRLDINLPLSSQFNNLRVACNDNYPVYFEVNGCTYEISIRKALKRNIDHG
jgi:methionyl-tRNA formyltransferase